MLKTFNDYLEMGRSWNRPNSDDRYNRSHRLWQANGKDEDEFSGYSTVQLKSICQRTDPNGDYDDIDVANDSHRQELIDSIKGRMEGDGYTSFEQWKRGK